jgi:murein DD-endopeptidase MepM/ murein hydrolase activator NlpD
LLTRHRTTARSILALLFLWALAGTAEAAVPRLVFPVVAKVSYQNDFGDPRSQGSHQGNDIMAAKRAPVVAVETGRVVKWMSSSAAGCMLYLYGRSGTTYMYVHLNNDRTRRNDNRGGCRNGIAYAWGLRSGQSVVVGRLIGFVGDSGDANGIASHLHFELHPNGGGAVSPYWKLRGARHHLYQRPPGTVTSLSLKVYGRIVATSLSTTPQLLTLRVISIELSNGWWVRPARRLTVTVPDGANVMRAIPGPNRATTLRWARIGERVLVWTASFPQTLGFARAPAGVIEARHVLLRGM